MPHSWLTGTPITGWVLPGVVLLIGVAVPQLAAAALIAAGGPRGLAAGYLAGLLLVAWIAVELLILQRYFFLQPVIAGIGMAQVLLAWRWHHSITPWGQRAEREGERSNDFFGIVAAGPAFFVTPGC